MKEVQDAEAGVWRKNWKNCHGWAVQSVIEEVYMWHPSIRNTSGKDEVAELYKSFGMTIFHDMLPRAKKAHELDELLRNAQREVQRIQEEIEELSCPTLRIE